MGKRNKKIIILGSSGMLGHQLKYVIESYPNFQLYNFSREKIKKKNNFYFEVKKKNKLEKLFKQIKPQIVVNCVGVLKNSKVNKNLYYDVNYKFPKFLSQLSKKINYKIINISTDCVFSGKKGNYKETDTPDPMDNYGSSKKFGEIKSNNVINIRTSIIGLEKNKNQRGLMEWFLNQKKDVQGYSKAYFSGLTTLELSRIIVKFFILNEKVNNFFLGKIVHVSGPKISKFNLLSKIQKIYGKKILIKKSSKIKIDRSLNSDNFIYISRYKKKSWNKMLLDYKNYEYEK